MTNDLFKNYSTFVENLLSKPSSNIEDLITRMRELDSSGCKVPQLLTGACGLSSESGEFMEIVKKLLLQGKPYTDDNIHHMVRELSDICFYLQCACIAIGVNLDDVILENIKKLESRYPGGKFDPHYSENRKAGDL